MERFIETPADREESWVSDRHLSELESEAKALSFDRLIDLHREGVLTMEEAIAAYKEEWPDA